MECTIRNTMRDLEGYEEGYIATCKWRYMRNLKGCNEVNIYHRLAERDGRPVRGSDGLKPGDHHTVSEWAEPPINQTETVSLVWTEPGLYRCIEVKGGLEDRRSMPRWLVAFSVWSSRVQMPPILSCRSAALVWRIESELTIKLVKALRHWFALPSASSKTETKLLRCVKK
ncbi:hypothetical protein PoB_004032200 [Plakobranchus ocellatus]|uniref:Uncharacterized protein n=1 Tax=Plakobranchus ocellatus TaxID=259542 RepID=A0AAV4B3W1_9GAST|nr:hypothetical protein PoB_004032200 [Plakobranchus ocellatus]